MHLLFNAIWERTIVHGKSFISSDLTKKFDLAKTMVGLFYFLLLWLSIRSFGHFSQNPEWDVIMASEDMFVPIWPTLWMSYVDWEFANRAVLLYFLLSSTLACVFWKRYRLVRAMVALGIFMYVAQVSSFGKIDHYNHLMVLAAFIFIFLPNIKNNEVTDKESFLQLFFGNQALILLTYFCSGYYKFKGIYEQEIWGMLSALSPESLAHNTAKTSLARGESYFLSDFIFEHPGYHFSAVLILGYFIELFSVYIIFKPHLHRLWGFVLILLHGMILLTVGPDFSIQILVLAIFLMFSPFSPSENGITDALQHLWNKLSSIFERTNKAHFIVYYDKNSAIQLAYVRLIKTTKRTHVECLDDKMSYTKLMHHNKELAAIKTLVVQNKEKPEELYIKAEALAVVFSSLHPVYKGFKWLYTIAPFFADLAHDILERLPLTKQKEV